MKRICCAGIALALTIGAPSAWASPGFGLCLPKREGGAVVTPRHGKCKRGYRFTRLGGETGAAPSGLTSGELETLKSILPYVSYLGAEIAGKPTIRFSGVNVQIVNGVGTTKTSNGEGNLILGYDEHEVMQEQTGSHDVIIGVNHTFTSFAGLVVGSNNAIAGPFASVSGGTHNRAGGESASVSGGSGNTANAKAASVSGGTGNNAEGFAASIGGGGENVANGTEAWVGGGLDNRAQAGVSSIFGNKFLTTTNSFEAIP